jgi:hypothetical protein
VRRALLAPLALFAIFFAGYATARAECPEVTHKLIEAQATLRAAEPAHDATPADFERRMGLIESAYEDASDAETIRTTTPGGCSDIQQVYDGMLTVSWAGLLLAYLKPSFEFYVGDASCKALSQLQTQSLILDADETMNRSLIAWNPFDPRLIANRAHVTHLVDAAAAYLHVPLPGPEQAEDYARQDRYLLEGAREKATVDCAASVTDSHIPPSIVDRIFATGVRAVTVP